MFFHENFSGWFWFVEIGFDHWRVKSGTHVSFENNWTLNIEVSSGVVNIVLVLFLFLVSQYLFVMLTLNLMIQRFMMMMDWTLWKVINWWWLNLHDWLVIDRTNMMMTMIEWLAVIWTNKFEQFCFLSLSHHQLLIDSLRKGQTRSFVRFHQQIFQFSAKGFFFDAGNSYVRPVHTAGTEIEYQSKVKIYQTETAQAPPKLLLISWCRFKRGLNYLQVL